jgi:hypothetical protein
VICVRGGAPRLIFTWIAEKLTPLNYLRPTTMALPVAGLLSAALDRRHAMVASAVKTELTGDVAIAASVDESTRHGHPFDDPARTQPEPFARCKVAARDIGASAP